MRNRQFELRSDLRKGGAFRFHAGHGDLPAGKAVYPSPAHQECRVAPAASQGFNFDGTQLSEPFADPSARQRQINDVLGCPVILGRAALDASA
jgi:hypothetical protein